MCFLAFSQLIQRSSAVFQTARYRLKSTSKRGQLRCCWLMCHEGDVPGVLEVGLRCTQARLGSGRERPELGLVEHKISNN